MYIIRKSLKYHCVTVTVVILNTQCVEPKFYKNRLRSNCDKLTSNREKVVLEAMLSILGSYKILVAFFLTWQKNNATGRQLA